MLLSKIYNRINNFAIQKKNSFDFHFQTWKKRKTTGAIAPKILKQLPLPQANQITTEVLLTAKNSSDYEDRKVTENEKVPIDVEISNDELVRTTMISISKRAAKRKMLEQQLSENTAKMNSIINCKFDCFFLI